MVTVWSEDSIETLKGCFTCIDWSISHSSNIDDATKPITSYILFCVENVVAKKTFTMYLNNKAYIKEVKQCINRKKAFRKN